MQEHLHIVRKQFQKDAYAKSLGIVLDALTDDTITMHMELRPHMLNMYDRPHGAIMYAGPGCHHEKRVVQNRKAN